MTSNEDQGEEVDTNLKVVFEGPARKGRRSDATNTIINELSEEISNLIISATKETGLNFTQVFDLVSNKIVAPKRRRENYFNKFQFAITSMNGSISAEEIRKQYHELKDNEENWTEAVDNMHAAACAVEGKTTLTGRKHAFESSAVDLQKMVSIIVSTFNYSILTFYLLGQDV